MTDKEIRIAIAEACGWEWKYFRQMGDGGSYGWVKDGCFPQNADPAPFPDYPNDLNAMHEAEEVLSYEQRRNYLRELFCVTVERDEKNTGISTDVLCNEDEMYIVTYATARQRAEAFLRTTGKWKERQ